MILRSKWQSQVVGVNALSLGVDVVGDTDELAVGLAVHLVKAHQGPVGPVGLFLLVQPELSNIPAAYVP